MKCFSICLLLHSTTNICQVIGRDTTYILCSLMMELLSQDYDLTSLMWRDASISCYSSQICFQRAIPLGEDCLLHVCSSPRYPSRWATLPSVTCAVSLHEAKQVMTRSGRKKRKINSKVELQEPEKERGERQNIRSRLIQTEKAIGGGGIGIWWVSFSVISLTWSPEAISGSGIWTEDSRQNTKMLWNK